jgi:hypothetical protein
MSSAVERFRDLIAASPTWQALTGAEGTPEEKRAHARARTYVSISPDGMALPFVVIDTSQDDFDQVGVGSTMTYTFTGEIFFRFVLAVPNESTESAQASAIETTRTGLRDDMLARSGVIDGDDTFIDLSNLRLDPGEVPELEDFSGQWWISGTATWGAGR